MLNNITIMGRLTKDPELRRTQSGIAVTSFSIACDRDYKPEGGERETDFVDCVAWRGTAEFVQKYFAKGRMAVVSGRLQIRPWTDKDGNKRRATEIVADNVYFGDSKPNNENGNSYAPTAQAPQQGFGGTQTGDMPASGGYVTSQQSFPTSPPMTEEYDDDDKLPF